MSRSRNNPSADLPIPTMRDVAERAGVAPATVSNVLTGRRSVRPELKERVAAAIAATGYRTNQLASSLRRMRSQTVGVMVPDLTNPFFAALVSRLEDIAAADGFEIILVGSHEDETRELARLQTLLSRQVDGLIIIPARDAASALQHEKARLPPTVLMDRGCGHGRFDSVTADNVAAARLGCEQLLALGHRDICFVVTSAALGNMRERITGYRAALAAEGLGGQARILAGGFDVAGSRAVVEAALTAPDRPSAIFAGNYVAALGAMQAIRALNLDCPRDVSLLSFDDSDWMTVLRPYVSAIAQPIEALADAAWHLLLDRLREPQAPPQHLRLPCSLAMRDSTRRIGQLAGRPPNQRPARPKTRKKELS